MQNPDQPKTPIPVRRRTSADLQRIVTVRNARAIRTQNAQ
jgi:hypothetical protein